MRTRSQLEKTLRAMRFDDTILSREEILLEVLLDIRNILLTNGMYSSDAASPTKESWELNS